MKKELLSLAIAATLLAAPLAPAQARGWDHGGWHHGGGGGGLLFGLGAAVGAVGMAAATVVAAPFEAVGSIAAPAPVYATPSYPGPAAPAYYAPPPVYAVPAPVYAPVYYAPRPVYYGYPGYVRAGYYGHRHY